MKGSGNLSHRGLTLVLLFLGLFATLVGSLTLKKQKSYLPTDAVISKIEEYYDASAGEDGPQYSYDVTVRYTVDGKEYEGPLGYHQDGYEEGQTVSIRYNPENPEKIVQASKGFAIYLVIIGPLLLAGAVINILKHGL